MKICLCFSGAPQPQLERCEVQTPLNGRVLSIRGKGNGAFGRFKSFHWSGAVRALCVLLVRAKLEESTQPTSSSKQNAEEMTIGHLSGGAGSLAASLDYALSKGPQWLIDMFGADKMGTPLAQRLIHRSNSGRKRPGPVILRLNLSTCETRNIRLFQDGEELLDSSSMRRLDRDLSLPRVPKLPSSNTNDPPATQGDRKDSISEREGAIFDTIVGLLLAKGRLEREEVREVLAADHGWLGSRTLFGRMVDQLTHDGFLLEDGEILTVKPRIADSIRQLFGDPTLHSISKPSAAIDTSNGHPPKLQLELETIEDLDRLLPQLHSKCLDFDSGRSREIFWYLQHSWWPLLRPAQLADQKPDVSGSPKVRFISGSDSAYDRWTAEKFTSDGVAVTLGSYDRGMPCDTWRIGDLVVVQRFESKLRAEIDAFLSSCRRPERLDPDQFRLQFFSEPTKVSVLLSYRPYSMAASDGVCLATGK